MVLEIEPTFYAAGKYYVRFELHGHGLSNIPSNAVGVWATDNNDPLASRETPYPMTILEKNDELLVIGQSYDSSHATPFYLGAILSPDRQVVYWINDTKPLP